MQFPKSAGLQKAEDARMRQRGSAPGGLDCRCSLVTGADSGLQAVANDKRRR